MQRTNETQLSKGLVPFPAKGANPILPLLSLSIKSTRKGNGEGKKLESISRKRKRLRPPCHRHLPLVSPSSSCASYPDGSTLAKRLSGMHQGQGIMVLDSMQRAARGSSAAVRVCNLVVSEMFRRASSCTSYATFWRSRRVISPGTRTQEKKKKKKRKQRARTIC
ncbi:hypothetical protein BJX65DRAFT_183257 [Aspergillus insuetus]